MKKKKKSKTFIKKNAKMISLGAPLVRVRKDEHPAGMKWGSNDAKFANRYLFKHRLVVEQELQKNWPKHPYLKKRAGFKGKWLSGVAAVHHIDQNRMNFKLSNLFIFPNKTLHSRYHALQRGRRYEAAWRLMQRFSGRSPWINMWDLKPKQRGKKAKFDPFGPGEEFSQPEGTRK